MTRDHKHPSYLDRQHTEIPATDVPFVVLILTAIGALALLGTLLYAVIWFIRTM